MQRTSRQYHLLWRCEDVSRRVCSAGSESGGRFLAYVTIQPKNSPIGVPVVATSTISGEGVKDLAKMAGKARVSDVSQIKAALEGKRKEPAPSGGCMGCGGCGGC